MPTYPWLLTASYDVQDVRASVRALKRAGVPYSDGEVEGVAASIANQGEGIVTALAGSGIETQADREIIALIAYLQRLGRDGRAHFAEQDGGGE